MVLYLLKLLQKNKIKKVIRYININIFKIYLYVKNVNIITKCKNIIFLLIILNILQANTNKSITTCFTYKYFFPIDSKYYKSLNSGGEFSFYFPTGLDNIYISLNPEYSYFSGYDYNYQTNTYTNILIETNGSIVTTKKILVSKTENVLLLADKHLINISLGLLYKKKIIKNIQLFSGFFGGFVYEFNILKDKSLNIDWNPLIKFSSGIFIPVNSRFSLKIGGDYYAILKEINPKIKDLYKNTYFFNLLIGINFLL